MGSIIRSAWARVHGLPWWAQLVIAVLVGGLLLWVLQSAYAGLVAFLAAMFGMNRHVSQVFAKTARRGQEDVDEIVTTIETAPEKHAEEDAKIEVRVDEAEKAATSAHENDVKNWWKDRGL